MQDEVKVSQADREAAANLLGGSAPDGLLDGRVDSLSLVQTLARHRRQAEREEEEAYKIGISEGRQEMVRDIDLATGGDGEFRWSTEPDRHCPCEEAMKARVIERLHQAERETLARMEPVAWMYTRPNDPLPPSIMAMRHDPEVFATMAKGGWTETPLFALPPAPEAGQ